MIHFSVEKEGEGRARAGVLRIRDIEIETPVFMPVGTYAAVKTLSPRELHEVGAVSYTHLTLPTSDLV